MNRWFLLFSVFASVEFVGATDAYQMALTQEIKRWLGSGGNSALEILNSDVSYFDGGTEGVALTVGPHTRLLVVLPHPRSPLAIEGRQVVIASVFDSLAMPIEVTKGGELEKWIITYIQRAKAPSSASVIRRLDRVKRVLLE